MKTKVRLATAATGVQCAQNPAGLTESQWDTRRRVKFQRSGEVPDRPRGRGSTYTVRIPGR
jgi:hypothetical protein